MTNHERVLVWREMIIWTQKVQALMKDVITPAVVEAVRADPPEYCYWEDATWLQKAMDVAGVHTGAPVVDILADRLPLAYSCVRAYHGCRPSDIESYYKDGFLPADPKLLNDLAARYFLRFPRITREILNRVIRDIEDQHRDGSIFFALDDRNLTTRCPHYLTYGSEYLAAIAHDLQRLTNEDCPAFLKTIGIPTIFICDLPIASTISAVRMLSGMLLECLFEGYVRPQEDIPVVDITLTVSVKLPPSIIVSHYHPEMRQCG